MKTLQALNNILKKQGRDPEKTISDALNSLTKAFDGESKGKSNGEALQALDGVYQPYNCLIESRTFGSSDILSWFSVLDLRNVELSDYAKSNLKQFRFNNYYYLKEIKADWSKIISPNLNYIKFENCSRLQKLDCSTMDTSNFTDMSSMFKGCASLTNINMSNFNTKNVINMASMFSGCTGLAKLDLSSFNAEKVLSMYGMFRGCTGLTELDLSSFKGGSITNAKEMFYGCSNLEKIDFSNFNVDNVTQWISIFDNCPKLTTVIWGENWGGKNSWVDARCSTFSRETILDLFNKLADRKEETSSPEVYILSATNKMLTDADREIASTKGWTITIV